MYEAHWHLDKKPFENDQNTSFFFESENHKEALVRIKYAVEQRKPLALLIGESGVGKTFVCHRAAEQLAGRNCDTGWVSAAGIEHGLDLLQQAFVAFSNGDPVPTSRAELTYALRKLLESMNGKGRYPVLIIDNADCLPDGRTFEELRTILDLTAQDGTTLLTCVLTGHPRLRGTLKKRHSLVHRLEVGYELLPLNAEEGAAYVNHRLEKAGAKAGLLDDEALAAAVTAAGGYPRLLNRLGDLGLLMGMIEGGEQVSLSLIEQAMDEVEELKKIAGGSSREQSRGGRSRGRGGRGRDRDRDRDRDDDDDREGGRRGRRRRRRGRGGRDRDRDRDGSSGDDAQDADGENLVFNADEHRDIESMTEIIQGTLKTSTTGGGRRRRRGGGSRAERGDPLHYFDSNVDGSDEAPVDDESKDEPKKRRRRRRGGRKSEDASETGAVESGDNGDEPGGADFAAGLLEGEKKSASKKAEKAEKAEKAPAKKAETALAKKAAKPKKAAVAAEPEPSSDFASGLLDE